MHESHGVVESERASGRMDVRTQTLKSARAIDAINGCVRLVAGKIDDEHRGAHTLPSTSASTLYLSLAGESRREPRAASHRTAPHRAARRAERMEQRPKYRFLGPYAAVRSMLVSAPCPVRPVLSAPSAFQNTDDARRARYAALIVHTQCPSPSTFLLLRLPGFSFIVEQRQVEIAPLSRSRVRV